jgi:hypothetical protein
MKRSFLILPLLSLGLVGCTASNGIALTTSNAATYLQFNTNSATSGRLTSATRSDDGVFTIQLDLYWVSKALNSDIKGTANLTFNPTTGVSGTTDPDPVQKTGIAFAFHQGEQETDNTKQADSVRGTFTYTNASLSAMGLFSTVTDFVWVTISGSVSA